MEGKKGLCFKAKYLLMEKNKNFECTWVSLYFSFHFLPVPNTHALTFMAHIFYAAILCFYLVWACF